MIKISKTKDLIFHNKEWLNHQYTELGKSANQIAKNVNRCHKTILYWLRKFNIPRRTAEETKKIIWENGKEFKKGIKTCSKCGMEYPATAEYFFRDKSIIKSGLGAICKKCRAKENSKYHFKNREKILKKNKEFYKNNREKVLKRNSEWQKANLDKIRKWRKENPEKQRGYKLKTDHNITLEDYNKMLKNQNGKCAICGCLETQINQYGLLSLSVDHNHKTEEIRGLLCSGCNHILGFAKDNPLILFNAIKYLQKKD